MKVVYWSNWYLCGKYWKLNNFVSLLGWGSTRVKVSKKRKRAKIDAEVAILLDLKRQLSIAEGKDPNDSAASGGKKKKNKKK